jgi:two-component system, NtrC family, sensor kinase
MKTTSSDLKLHERVKELKCLYDIFQIAWEEPNNIPNILTKTLTILANAMRYPDQARVSISLKKECYSTHPFTNDMRTIISPIGIEKKKYGAIRIGYKNTFIKPRAKHSFLHEEKRLLKIIARQLALYIKRASIEEDRKNLQMQLQHAERLAFVGELSAGIAHELNEPLGRILGFAQLIKKEGELNHQQNEDIERIVKASLYTREIIKKLMIFSRQMPQQITLVNLNTIVSNILYFIDIRFHSNGIKIVERLENNLPSIQADEVQMSQVLVNLITNAIHALSKEGKITVSTKRKGNKVSLTVKDTGSGMPAELKKKIFEPFFTTKSVGEGTGLGLSVVHGIVESHNGNIKVVSWLGKGSKFEILLPIKHTHS